MVKAEEAIAAARRLIGTPYSEMDCINLIKKVIRTAPGGVPGYKTAGTNTLWKSATASTKYRDLIWRKNGIDGACAGMLAFKRSGDDVHHVGIVTQKGTVIHSSSTQNGRGVVETPLSSDEGWNLLAKHRFIEVLECVMTDAETEGLKQSAEVTIVDSAGRRFMPEGDFRVYMGSVD